MAMGWDGLSALAGFAFRYLGRCPRLVWRRAVGANGFEFHLPRQQTRQQQVARPVEMSDSGAAKLREQPDGRLLDKLVFGVGVGHGLTGWWQGWLKTVPGQDGL